MYNSFLLQYCVQKSVAKRSCGLLPGTMNLPGLGYVSSGHLLCLDKWFLSKQALTAKREPKDLLFGTFFHCIIGYSGRVLFVSLLDEPHYWICQWKHHKRSLDATGNNGQDVHTVSTMEVCSGYHQYKQCVMVEWWDQMWLQLFLFLLPFPETQAVQSRNVSIYSKQNTYVHFSGLYCDPFLLIFHGWLTLSRLKHLNIHYLKLNRFPVTSVKDWSLKSHRRNRPTGLPQTCHAPDSSLINALCKNIQKGRKLSPRLAYVCT